jgi:ribosomal protein L29
MTRIGRIADRVLRGTSDAAIRFDELRTLLAALRFAERTRGSQHIFSRDGIAEIINLQPRAGGLAKPYQVRQVRAIIVKYRLTREVER